jgi:uncharacterized protein YciI
MKYFVVEATYLVPFERIKELIPPHAAWLQQGFDKGLFLCSGPQDPPVGGLIVARARSMADLRTMFEKEPFNVAKVASYAFKEFQPVMRQGWANHWFDETKGD